MSNLRTALVETAASAVYSNSSMSDVDAKRVTEIVTAEALAALAGLASDGLDLADVLDLFEVAPYAAPVEPKFFDQA